MTRPFDWFAHHPRARRPGGEPMTTEPGLRRLLDESDLRDLIHRYAIGLDTRDWELWRSIFTDDVIIDLSDYEPDPPPRRLPIDTFLALHPAAVRRVRRDPALHRHAPLRHRRRPGDHHGPHARRALADVRAGHRPLHDVRHLHRRVRADRRRVGGSRAVKLTLLREEGNRHLMRLAARRGAERTREGA